MIQVEELTLQYPGGKGIRGVSFQVEEEQVIPDVYAALLEQEEIGALQIIRWPEIGEKRREKIVETEAVVIAEQKLLTQPHSPFAGYIQDKYPAAWALALERREGK